MESHASAARSRLIGPARGARVARRRPAPLHRRSTSPSRVGVAALLATIAFVGNGGLQLGLVDARRDRRDHDRGRARRGGARARRRRARPSTAAPRSPPSPALAGLTALSILWSLYPRDSWVETNRTLAYVAAFAAGHRGRAARARALGRRSLWGVLLALARGQPLRARDQGRARLARPGRDLRPPARAVRLLERGRASRRRWASRSASGSARATRAGARRASLAYPLLALFIVTMLLSFSRGSIVAALVGVALWLAIVPLRLRSLALLAALGAGRRRS